MSGQLGLGDFFQKYLQKEPLIVNKKVLQEHYIPDVLLHRQQQIELIASMLVPALRNEKPSNVFVYGKPGVGKTACIQYIISHLEATAKTNGANLKTIYLNCKLRTVANTEYRVMAELARGMGVEVPATGLPTDEVYNKFIAIVDQKPQIVILVLDEVDRLIAKAGDEILYNLTRINSSLKNAQVSLIGISNDVRFMENIDPRVKSSLGEEEVIFPPYNAIELKEILEKRAIVAFRPNALAEGVLEKAAAVAAREHGDARRALALLKVAGEVAERDNSEKVKAEHIDKAEESIEKDRVMDIISSQPKQSQLVLHAILLTATGRKIETGEVYEKYRDLCIHAGQSPLTQRRISDLIGELDMLGIINAKVISKGRYGRTREIYISISDELLSKIKVKLQEEL